MPSDSTSELPMFQASRHRLANHVWFEESTTFLDGFFTSIQAVFPNNVFDI